MSNAELLADVYNASRWLLLGGCLLVPAALLLYLLAWEPLCAPLPRALLAPRSRSRSSAPTHPCPRPLAVFSRAYTGAGASLGAQLFGYISGAGFLVGILTLIPLVVCIHIFSALIKLFSTVALESSLDGLSPQIATLGLRRFLANRRRIFEDLEAKPHGNVHKDLTLPPLEITDESLHYFQVRM